MHQRIIPVRRNLRTIITIMERLDTRLWLSFSKERQKVKKICSDVPCFLNVICRKNPRNNGLILEPFAMFILLKKHLLHMLPLESKKYYPWEIPYSQWLNVMEMFSWRWHYQKWWLLIVVEKHRFFAILHPLFAILILCLSYNVSISYLLCEFYSVGIESELRTTFGVKTNNLKFE